MFLQTHDSYIVVHFQFGDHHNVTPPLTNQLNVVKQHVSFKMEGTCTSHKI